MVYPLPFLHLLFVHFFRCRFFVVFFFLSDESGPEAQDIAKALGIPLDKVKHRIQSLKESNPMLGHRGCRLGITYPEIYDMQVRAIFEAACEVKRQGKPCAPPEVMIPLVGKVEEFTILKENTHKVAAAVMKEQKMKFKYQVGTIIEAPRAAVTADTIAKEAEFFSFGTNDLTQMGCGFSRDDAGSFLGQYVELGIFEKDPFQVLLCVPPSIVSVPCWLRRSSASFVLCVSCAHR